MTVNYPRMISIIISILTLLLSVPLALAEETVVDVSDLVQVDQSRMRFDRRSNTSYLEVTITNNSDKPILGPIVLVVESISDDSVTVKNADGDTDDGGPFIDVLPDRVILEPGQSTEPKRLEFSNSSRARFSFSSTIWGITAPEAVDGLFKVTSTGGQFETDNGIKIDVPVDALSKETAITVTLKTGTIDNGYLINNETVVSGISFEPDGLIFNLPIKVTFPLQTLNSVGKELALKLYDPQSREFFEEGALCVVDDTGFACVAEVTHYSYYAVIENGDHVTRLWDIDGGINYPRDDGEYIGEAGCYPRQLRVKPIENYPRDARLPNSIMYMSPDLRDDYLSKYLYPINWPVKEDCFYLDSARLFGSISRKEIKDSENIIPILLVHGFKGNAVDGSRFTPYWTSKEQYGELPKLLRQLTPLNNNNSKFEIFEFQWRTNVRFQDAAQDLYRAVLTLHGATGNKVHLIAHSFGGVLSRVMLQKMFFSLVPIEEKYFVDFPHEDPSNFVQSLMTFGSPQSGIMGFERETPWGRFPDGRDDELINLAFQLSTHQAGENYPGLNKTAYQVGSLSGGIIGAIANLDQYPFPDVPFLSNIGLHIRGKDWDNAWDFPFTVQDGDGLISYAGQRVKPDWAVDHNSELKCYENFNDSLDKEPLVTEHVLGIVGGPENYLPNSPHTDKQTGYGHSEKNSSWAVWRSIPVGVVELPWLFEIKRYHKTETLVFADECNDAASCTHDGFRVIKKWLLDGGAYGYKDRSLCQGEEIIAQDLDGDGYTDHDDGDCDDNPFTGKDINPGAEEECDNIDNDCDGDVDEGCGGGNTEIPVFNLSSSNPLINTCSLGAVKEVKKYGSNEYRAFVLKTNSACNYPADFNADLLTSTDGIHWHEAKSGIINRNLSGYTFNYYPTELKENGVYKLWLSSTSNSCISYDSVYYYESHDGINYSKVQTAFSRTESYETRKLGQMHIVEADGTYYMYYKPSIGGACSGYSTIGTTVATSPNGKDNWTKHGIIIPEVTGGESSPFKVVYDDGVFEGFLSKYENGKYIPYYYTSANGINWNQLGVIESIPENTMVSGVLKEGGEYKYWYYDTISKTFNLATTGPDDDVGSSICTDSDYDGYYGQSGCLTAIDCDDDNALVHPGADENCYDGYDNNCDGIVDCNSQVCTDNDLDGYPQENYCSTPVDCDDSDSSTYPNAIEICDDGMDNDCDLLFDCNDPECNEEQHCNPITEIKVWEPGYLDGYIEAGQMHIEWDLIGGNSGHTVAIELSVDGQTTWQTIHPSVGGNEFWTTYEIGDVVDEDSDDCYIRVSSTSDPSIFDVSRRFTIQNYY